MNKQEKVNYWIKSAENDWMVAGHLFEKEDYPYALFFGHLTIEKLLKALFVNKFDEPPPYTHRLTYLAEKAGVDISSDKLELLEIITDFNLETRYPDEKFTFFKKCTKEFTEAYLRKIEELKEWLLQLIQQ
jgi:HEPN domain-containing protein